MHWLTRHASYLLTKHHVGTDHCTGYQRLHGKGSRERVAEFGEHVLYFAQARRRSKLEPKWRRGVFLGRAWNSDANFIGLASGQVTTARAITRTILPDRWSRQRIQRVTGTPIDQSLAFADEIEEEAAPRRGPDAQRDDGPDDGETMPRRMPIPRRDIDEHGCSARPHVTRPSQVRPSPPKTSHACSIV